MLQLLYILEILTLLFFILIIIYHSTSDTWLTQFFLLLRIIFTDPLEQYNVFRYYTYLISSFTLNKALFIIFNLTKCLFRVLFSMNNKVSFETILQRLLAILNISSDNKLMIQNFLIKNLCVLR